MNVCECQIERNWKQYLHQWINANIYKVLWVVSYRRTVLRTSPFIFFNTENFLASIACWRTFQALVLSTCNVNLIYCKVTCMETDSSTGIFLVYTTVVFSSSGNFAIFSWDWSAGETLGWLRVPSTVLLDSECSVYRSRLSSTSLCETLSEMHELPNNICDRIGGTIKPLSVRACLPQANSSYMLSEWQLFEWAYIWENANCTFSQIHGVLGLS